MLYTRNQYLAGEVSHHDYHLQFVTDETIQRVKSAIGVERIAKSQDKHLNDISLHIWDKIPYAYNKEAMKAAGDHLTKAAWVCIAKCAARELNKKDL